MIDWNSSGRLFHSLWPLKVNARWPAAVLQSGMCRRSLFLVLQLCTSDLQIAFYFDKKGVPVYCRCTLSLVSLVGRAPVCWAAGHGFEPRPDQDSGSLNNWKESAAFVMTSANGYSSQSSQIRTKNRRSRLTALSLIWFLWDVKEPTPLFEKSRGRRRRWRGQPSHIISIMGGWVQ